MADRSVFGVLDGHRPKAMGLHAGRTCWLPWVAPDHPRRRTIYITTAVLLVFGLLSGGYRSYPRPERVIVPYESTYPVALEPQGAKYGPYVKYWPRQHWKGWPSIEYMFVFGDSWSITGFIPEGQQPTVENPLGNPAFPGETSTNGPNWVDYLTYAYNQSLVLTANIAAGGATVDMDLISPGVDKGTLRSLKTQMIEQFPAIYGHHPPAYPWKVDSTLFIIWIGLNDIHNANDESKHLFGSVFEEYAKCIDVLYQNGARNIMFMNIPPIERAPLADIIDTYDDWHHWVADWNQNTTSLVHNFTSTYDDVTTFIFDAFGLYGDVMTDPCTMPETCGSEVTVKFCPWYAFSAPTLTFKHPKCDYSIDKYFWMNDLHPTTHTHNMTAHALAMALTTTGIK